jgi:hypothetical protein
MHGMKKPTRQKKSDRLISPKSSEAEQKIDMMLAPLTRAIDLADRKYGIDCAPELVSPETAAKWGMCLSRLNDAVDAHDVEEVAKWVGASIRGLAYMEAEIASSGALRASLDVFEVEDGNGNIFAIMDDGRSWQKIQEQRPDRKLVTRREAAIALAFYQQHAIGIMTEEVRANFPKAEVIAVNDNLNDEIKL